MAMGNPAYYAPAQGRATFKPIVLRRWNGGGLYCPSPSPPGFPRSKDIGGVCSLHSATLRSGRKPFINGSKGEEFPGLEVNRAVLHVEKPGVCVQIVHRSVKARDIYCAALTEASSKLLAQHFKSLMDSLWMAYFSMSIRSR
jgi:hypothetical protein